MSEGLTAWREGRCPASLHLLPPLLPQAYVVVVGGGVGGDGGDGGGDGGGDSSGGVILYACYATFATTITTITGTTTATTCNPSNAVPPCLILRH